MNTRRLIKMGSGSIHFGCCIIKVGVVSSSMCCVLHHLIATAAKAGRITIHGPELYLIEGISPQAKEAKSFLVYAETDVFYFCSVPPVALSDPVHWVLHLVVTSQTVKMRVKTNPLWFQCIFSKKSYFMWLVTVQTIQEPFGFNLNGLNSGICLAV